MSSGDFRKNMWRAWRREGDCQTDLQNMHFCVVLGVAYVVSKPTFAFNQPIKASGVGFFQWNDNP